MREIRFRAWDEKNKTIWGNRQSLEMLMRQAIHDFYPTQPNNGSDYKGEIIWMQFTGLHDKNNNPIYEGDIVKGIWWCDYIYEGVVKFGVTSELDNDYYGWYVEYTNHNGWVSHQSPHDISDKFEIIGNIYESPLIIK